MNIVNKTNVAVAWSTYQGERGRDSGIIEPGKKKYIPYETGTYSVRVHPAEQTYFVLENVEIQDTVAISFAVAPV